MREEVAAKPVQIQVVEMESGREINWSSNLSESLESRLEDIRSAIASGCNAVSHSLASLPAAEGWKLGEVSASFGITLSAEAGVILTKASASSTFEVTVKYQHAK